MKQSVAEVERGYQAEENHNHMGIEWFAYLRFIEMTSMSNYFSFGFKRSNRHFVEQLRLSTVMRVAVLKIEIAYFFIQAGWAGEGLC